MSSGEKKKVMCDELRRVTEAERIAAEREFLEKHERERRLGKGATRESKPGGYISAASSTMESEMEVDPRRKRAWTSPNETERKKAKSRKVDVTEDEGDSGDDEVVDEVFGSDPLQNVGKTLKRIRDWLKLPQIVKMVKKSYASKLEGYLYEVQEQIARAREERVALETKVEERSKNISEVLRTVVREELKVREEMEDPMRKPTFAQVLGRKEIPKVTGMKGPVLPVPNRVVIRQENKESEEVKKKLKELVKPTEIGLKVRRLSKIRNGVVIEAENEEGVKNLLENEALKKAGMTVGMPTRRNPVVMVYDVNSALSDKEIKEEIFKRNMQGSEIEEEEFTKDFVVKHKYQERDGRRKEDKRNHVVAECSVKVRNWLRKKGRVYIEWESCRIKDYVDLARCFKCQRFGHVAKFCTNAKPSCSHCSGEHDYKECNKKAKEGAKCINCGREGRADVKHPASWRGCPVYEKAIKRYSAQIDYGV